MSASKPRWSMLAALAALTSAAACQLLSGLAGFNGAAGGSGGAQHATASTAGAGGAPNGSSSVTTGAVGAGGVSQGVGAGSPASTASSTTSIAGITVSVSASSSSSSSSSSASSSVATSGAGGGVGVCGYEVFVTTKTYAATALATHALADSACNNDPLMIDVASPWKAVISTGEPGGAAVEYLDSLFPTLPGATVCRAFDGKPVAGGLTNPWWSAQHLAPINLDSAGVATAGAVWSASDHLGNYLKALSCAEWTSVKPADFGAAGNSTAVNSQWLNAANPLVCDQPGHLYCIAPKKMMQ